MCKYNDRIIKEVLFDTDLELDNLLSLTRSQILFDTLCLDHLHSLLGLPTNQVIRELRSKIYLDSVQRTFLTQKMQPLLDDFVTSSWFLFPVLLPISNAPPKEKKQVKADGVFPPSTLQPRISLLPLSTNETPKIEHSADALAKSPGKMETPKSFAMTSTTLIT
eukprot:GHVP01005656.1.p1 GENE.GHVP01005656.1~~GHVP01005656.1.p1  ORF type:complete len:164 (+),score=19.88 GHVP01005656.1:341-832(+)